MQRRTLITGLAALAGSVGTGRLLASEKTPSATGAGACKLITQDVRGPFDVVQYAERSDLLTGQSGVPLTLNFQVVNAMSCAPVPGAKVFIWHANHQGWYSGVENEVLNADGTSSGRTVDLRGENFHRGVQTTDDQGRVRFVTAFPGWYFPRVTHLHLKVYPPEFGEEAVTQLYFPAEVCDEVYAGEAYQARGPNPNRTKPGDVSPIFSFDQGDLWLNLKRNGDGYEASHELGVVFYGGMFGELPDLYRQG